MRPAELERMRDLEETHFWFRARRRELRPWLEEAFASAPTGPVLDLGVGTGRNLELFSELQSSRQVIGIDSSEVAISHCTDANPAVKLLQAEAMKIPLGPASVAIVTALDVLEHLRDDRTALAEIARCLIPGGELIATIPAHPGLFSRHDLALGHRRRYRRLELDSKLEAAGLEIIESRAFNSLLLPLVALWRLPGRLRTTRGIPRSDVQPLAPFLNKLLGTILALESSIPVAALQFSGLSWWVRARLRS